MSHCTANKKATSAFVRRNSIPTTGAVAKALFNSAIGIDVHHDILVCAYQYCNRESDEITTEVCSFGTTASELAKFTDWCRNHHPEQILMESTGVLWFSPYEVLESVGFTNRQLSLINARDFKAIVGRKSDKQDAERLALYARIGNVRSSFVPAKCFREMRAVSRLLSKTTDEQSRARSRYLKTLNFIVCRASSVFSDVRGKAATAILEVLAEGTREQLIDAIKIHGRRLRKSAAEILDALDFAVSPAMAMQLRIQKQHMEALSQTCEELYALLKVMQANYQPWINRLMTVPGIKERAAWVIFAEVTNDLSSFPDAAHLASWVGVCPGTMESAGKRYSGRAAKVNRYLRRILVECSQAIGLMRKGALYSLFQAFKERKGTRRAVVAMAHHLVKIIYCLFTKGGNFEAQSTDALTKVRKQKYLSAVANIKKQNFEILTSGSLVDKATGAITTVDPMTV